MASETCKVGTVELIFHSVSENVVVLTEQLEKVLNSPTYFESRSFFFAPLHQEIECASIVIAPAVDCVVNAIEKHLELASNEYPLTTNAAHTSMNQPFLFFLFFGIFGTFFEVFDNVISRA